ncbi:SDR family NAD(P)-dependent oxidoreductase [Nakamurella multipartita]|uniref:Short-chain dehydrogenase/reductase SDR n=1 Tax=Nakamurella multipartita (strain ATCC 700099 / DSM 44233 / CIP 104796 / JCM 9543 / NBRC 105858 / Y-104) TaxID=479431 RepID=C8XIU4_NAKMY|nr:SDR family NAD(P)-dependent oxidoreductase [Nakamurella multipartita]ACV76531.1 short-chain dehydrogenase/reductase SDR [Nakamurella multipartita DSM 44233]
MARIPQALTGAADRVLDALVVPGYSKIGVAARRHWWPADPVPFARRVDVVVTGASSGLGAAAAQGLAALGARIQMVGRKAARLESAADRIRAAVPDAELVVREADISDLGSVRALAATLREELTDLHGLVHCAGLMPPERTLTDEGNELAFATHVLGPLLLTTELRPLLAADGDGRVVFVSSGGMYSAALSDDFDSSQGEYKGVRAYARTKRMQVTLTEQLALTFDRIDDPVVHSMHPGWAQTPGVTDSLPGFDKVAKPILRTPDQGADTIVWLVAAAEPSRSSGRFWHDRRVRPTHYLPWQHDDPAIRATLWRESLSRTGATL